MLIEGELLKELTLLTLLMRVIQLNKLKFIAQVVQMRLLFLILRQLTKKGIQW